MLYLYIIYSVYIIYMPYGISHAIFFLITKSRLKGRIPLKSESEKNLRRGEKRWLTFDF